MFTINTNLLRLFALVILLGGVVSVASADDDGDEEHEHGSRAVVSNAKWQAECGACHVAFPSRMLPAASWREMMAGLDKHFGTDASLEPAVALEIWNFLEQNASQRKSVSTGKPLLRISETSWFVREHRRVSDATWKLVKSPANCAACHTQAESGDYRERNIRMPK